VPFVRQPGTFAQTLDEIAKRLANHGDVDAKDDGSATRRRRVSFLVAAPGYGAPTVAIFEYRERYRRMAEGWLREAYAFEYRPVTPRSRRAHHQHGTWGIHQHCEPPGEHSREHYEDVERLLELTLEEFGGMYERAELIRCVGLRRKRRFR
jgi:hypothetical protein